MQNSLLLAECGPLAEIVNEIEVEWTSDNFDVETHIKDFWKIHQRFGFIRDNGKIILIAKDREMAKSVLGDFEAIGYGKSDLEIELDLPIEGIKYDVTGLLPEVIRKLHGKSLRYDGGNCWNFCLRELVTKGSLPMSADEFKHWLASPLAKELRNFEDLQPGDIIAFRKAEEGSDVFARNEVHGAMYLSPRLALAKSAMGRYFPYRILDLNEAIGYYYPNRSSVIQVFRLQNIHDAARRLNSASSARLRQWIERAWELEAESDAIFYGRKSDGKPITSSENWKLIDRFESFGEELRDSVQIELKNLDVRNEADLDAQIERSIWQGLLFKANNYIKLQLVVD